MTSTRLKTLPRSAQECIEAANQKLNAKNINNGKPTSDLYRKYVLTETNGYTLSETEWKKIARHLGIEWISCSNKISARWSPSWLPSISMEFMSTRYTSPNCDEEFVILISSRSIFGVKGVIEHTKEGYKDPTWFTDLVPSLVEVSKDYFRQVHELPTYGSNMPKVADMRRIGNTTINDPINAEYVTMTFEQVRTVSAFFGEYLPGIEGICSKCFALKLPERGLGARWMCADLQQAEIRLSVPKPDQYPCQKILYVTHQYKPGKKAIYVKYEGIIHDNYGNWTDNGGSTLITKNNKLPTTHIPWECYLYAQTVEELPLIKGTQVEVCKCPQKTL